MYFPLREIPTVRRRTTIASDRNIVRSDPKSCVHTRRHGISKRGNPYLRKVFIHGARASVLRLKRERSLIGAWMSGLEARAPRNVLIVAMANELARITWVVLSSGNDYRAAAGRAFVETTIESDHKEMHTAEKALFLTCRSTCSGCVCVRASPCRD